MKFVITRQLSLKKQKFDITRDSKSFGTVRAEESKEKKGRFSIKLLSLSKKDDGYDKCIVEPDPQVEGKYRIYEQKGDDNRKLFGEWHYASCGAKSYNTVYAISIGEQYYTVRSSDLKDRRLSIVGTIEQKNINNSHEQSTFNGSQTLLQTIDPFCKSNDIYHVTIHDKENQLGYLAIIVLFDLHEGKRSCG